MFRRGGVRLLGLNVLAVRAYWIPERSVDQDDCTLAHDAVMTCRRRHAVRPCSRTSDHVLRVATLPYCPPPPPHPVPERPLRHMFACTAASGEHAGWFPQLRVRTASRRERDRPLRVGRGPAGAVQYGTSHLSPAPMSITTDVAHNRSIYRTATGQMVSLTAMTASARRLGRVDSWLLVRRLARRRDHAMTA
jgi:hypothetical protein